MPSPLRQESQSIRSKRQPRNPCRAYAADRVEAKAAEEEEEPLTILRVGIKIVGPLRVGSRARIKQPGYPALVWEVTELDEGTSFTWVTHTPGVDAIAAHLISATADGSRLTLSVTWTGVFGGLAGALAGKRTRKSLTLDANGHKACAEAVA